MALPKIRSGEFNGNSKLAEFETDGSDDASIQLNQDAPCTTRSVRWWLLMLILACLIPGVIGTAFLLLNDYRDNRAQLEASTIQTARALVLTVDAHLSKTESVAQALAASPLIDEGRWREFQEQADESLRRAGAGRNVIVANASGQQMVNTLKPYGTQLPTVAQLEPIRQVLATGQPVVSNLLPGSVLNQVVGVYVPVLVGDAIPYVLGIGITPDEFAKLLHAQRLPTDWPTSIVDADGTIVARTHSPERFVGQHAVQPFINALHDRGEGAVETATREGIPVVSVFSRSPLTHWGVGIGIPRAMLHSAINSSIFLLLGAVSVLFLAGFAVAWLVGNRIIASIHSLAAMARSLGEGKQITRVPTSVTEVKAVAEALAEASAALQERTNALSAAKREAEDASRAKSAFLRTMSHEMRTPLHIIGGLSHLLKRDLKDPLLMQRVEQMNMTSDHLLDLINELLDLSKIEAKRLVLNEADFALGEVVDRVLSGVASLACHKGLDLHTDIPNELRTLHLRGDALRLAQILINLSSNAVKFTDRGHVRFRIECLYQDVQGVRLRFEIADTGSGIDHQFAQHLFEPFSQADGSATRVHGGTGLGLAISQALARLMGGRIKVESEPGMGSCFHFELDLERAAGTSKEAKKTDPFQVWGRSVLLVEDHPLSQEILFEMLEDLGCEVDVASDGAEAVECARLRDYDVILMDIQMPGMDGIQATRMIRAASRNATTPIIALTANAFGEDRQLCMEAGMNGHLAKPVNPQTLMTAVGPGTQDCATFVTPRIEPRTEEEKGLAQSLNGVPQLDPGNVYRRSGRLREYCELLHRFVDIHAGDIERVRELMEANDLEQAKATSHRLKGIVGFLGALPLSTALDQLHRALRDESDVIAEAVERCATEMTALVQAIRTLPDPRISPASAPLLETA